MNHRFLGKSRLEVSEIGLGCRQSIDESHNESQWMSTIHRALELGVNFFDTSDSYGDGESEKLLGKSLKGRRHQAIVATKFGILFGGGGKRLGVSGEPGYVEKACDASLKRLGMDYVDLFYLHRVDPRTAIEDTVGAMAGLVNKGKVRYIGLSEASSTTTRRAHAIHPITALQTEYSLWTRHAESHVLPACRELGIGFVAYGPLGYGFLTGKVRSVRKGGKLYDLYPRLRGENLDQNLNRLKAVEELAAKRHCTPSCIAIAWLLAKGQDIVPIPGSRSCEHLEENVKGSSIELSETEMRKLDAFSEEIVGERYNEAMMQTVDL